MTDATTRLMRITPALFAAGWAFIGITLAASDVLGHAPAIGPAFVLASVMGWTLAYRRGGPVRAWLDQRSLRALIAIHAIRLPIGLAFLWEMSRGRLAPLFATRAGYGDVAIGALAIAALVLGAHAPQRRRWLAAFSLLGLADILVALGTGTYLMLAVRDPQMLDAIRRLPYPLLPFLIVPTVVLGHVLVLARISGERER